MSSPTPEPDRTQHRALPAWVYRHAPLTPLEVERVLRPSWQIATHESAVPMPGDYTTVDLGPDRIVVLRDRDGQIRAYHNVCRHRGARLLDGSGRCAGVVTCPYHGWTYQLDGRLTGVPSRDLYGDLDRGSLGLKPVHVDRLLGFVFVCFGDVAPAPLKTTFAPFLEELAPYRIEEMVPLGPVGFEDWDVDWKLAVDNYLESYHVPIGHPGLFRLCRPDYEDQKAAPMIGRGTGWIRDVPSPRWSERAYQQLLARTDLRLPPSCHRAWRHYSFLPNLGLDVYPEQMDFFQVLPLGPGRCRIRYGLFGLPDERREVRVLRRLSNRINASINREDRDLCMRVQRGLESPSYTPGPLSGLEYWMIEFHQMLASRIPEVRLAEPPATFAAPQGVML
jgi:phenylpropionate dioxygenase-like ring-hydroxylating dioxygenase large terminal subunit